MKKTLLICLLLCANSLALTGDFTGDNKVDGRDLAIFANYWLGSPVADPNCDLDSDGSVNFIDFSLFAANWTGLIECPNCPPPEVASSPSPANDSTGVDVNENISWTAGEGADSHDVYFGTSNPPPFVVNQPDTSYEPNTLLFGTRYYWQIDEKNVYGTTTGTIWNFTTRYFADSCSYSGQACEALTINLYGQAVGEANYIITSFPQNGILCDPKTGLGVGKISSVPYTLCRYGNVINYYSTQAGTDSFTFKVNDSEQATASLTISENSGDYLAFDGVHYAVCDDNDYLDTEPNWAFAFWFKTTSVSQGLVLKKHTTGKGVEMYLLQSGYVQARLFDVNNTKYILESGSRVNDGYWHFVCLEAEITDSVTEATLKIYGETVYGEDSSEKMLVIDTVIDCNNSANFYVGGDEITRVQASFDRLCVFKSNGIAWNTTNLFLTYRNGTDYGIGSAPNGAEWRFSEGSGGTTVGSINGLILVFDANYVQWHSKGYIPVDRTINNRNRTIYIFK